VSVCEHRDTVPLGSFEEAHRDEIYFGPGGLVFLEPEWCAHCGAIGSVASARRPLAPGSDDCCEHRRAVPLGSVGDSLHRHKVVLGRRVLVFASWCPDCGAIRSAEGVRLPRLGGGTLVVMLTPRTAHSYLKRPRAASQLWTVPALAAAYDWPSGLPGGGVIAIVELGGGWVEADLDQYFQGIGQPTPSVTDVSVDGTTNQGENGGDASVEVALDIEVAAAAYYAATGKAATVRVYWSEDIPTAVMKASADGCDVCSISWGADEADWGASGCQGMESAASAATAAGMVVFAAAGDNDASDGGSTPANVDCPASCPHVVGCGGTSKSSTAEVVWDDDPDPTDPDGEGTGGGYSTVFPPQSWQSGAPAPPASSGVANGRMVPDVAADADPNTGYLIVEGGAAQVVGGTSAVAPLYAGLFAAFGKKLGYVLPKLWQNQGAFTDITVGGNGLFSALVGPDPCTGIGVPVGSKLAALLSASAPPAPAPTPPTPTPVPPAPAPTLSSVLAAVRAAYGPHFVIFRAQWVLLTRAGFVAAGLSDTSSPTIAAAEAAVPFGSYPILFQGEALAIVRASLAPLFPSPLP
jgi:kumamolisin